MSLGAAFKVVVRRPDRICHDVIIQECSGNGWGRYLRDCGYDGGKAVLFLDGGLPGDIRDEIVRQAEENFPGALHILKLKAGESLKSLDGIESILNELAKSRLRRDGLIIAAGGGTIGDAVGFAASIWHRGTPWVLLPTTLLSQVDSAVGGKVGINYSRTKNLVGAFHQPRRVICISSWIRSLPTRDYRSGLGEIVKYALGMDTSLWSLLERSAEAVRARESFLLGRLVRRSIAIKASLVCIDERDTGLRRLLNLGHTFAHAFEVSEFDLFHGEAVALGLRAAALLSESLGVAEPGLAAAVEKMLKRLELRHSLPRAACDEVYRAMKADKKHGSDESVMILPTGIGTVMIYKDPPEDLILKALQGLA